MSFISDMIAILVFPNEKVRENCSENGILKCLPYHILTDIDSTSIIFAFIC